MKICQSGNDWLLSSPSIGVFLQVEQQPLGENQPESKVREQMKRGVISRMSFFSPGSLFHLTESILTVEKCLNH